MDIGKSIVDPHVKAKDIHYSHLFGYQGKRFIRVRNGVEVGIHIWAVNDNFEICTYIFCDTLVLPLGKASPI